MHRCLYALTNGRYNQQLSNSYDFCTIGPGPSRKVFCKYYTNLRRVVDHVRWLPRNDVSAYK